MGVSATKLYTKHKGEHDLDMQRFERARRNALATKNFSLVQGRSGSKALDEQSGSAIIISASGMATGGRVLHHLARFLPDAANTVLFVGFQASGTRGRRLLNGEEEIKIHGQMIPVRANIESIGSLSAHADAGEILRWLGGFRRPPKKTFIIHGEPDAAQALRDRVEKELGWTAVIPTYQETVELE
jgi:metallo-beta-lactamase family protein